MKKFDESTRLFFDWVGLVICRRAWAVVGVMLLVTIGLGSQMSKLTIDASTESFFHDTDPVILKYHEFQEQFGRDDIIILALNPPEVFSREFFERLDTLHTAIEADVPHVEKVTSMINARSTRGRGDELVVDGLLDEWPADAAEMGAFRARVVANPLYRNSLISEDGRFTTITIQPDSFSFDPETGSALEGGDEMDLLAAFDEEVPERSGGEDSMVDEPSSRPYLTDAEKTAMVDALLKVVEQHKRADFPIHVAGSPVVDQAIKDNLQRDMGLFMGLELVVIAIILFALFRRISPVLLSLLIVVVSLVATLGLMALAGAPITIPTQILPSFLLAVGIADSVHVLSLFFKHLEQNPDRRVAIRHALSHSGRAIVLTSLTTAGGLMSFAGSELAPVADLGIYAPAGVLFTLLYSLTLLPALLAVVPLRSVSRGAEQEQVGAMDRVLWRCAEYSISNPRRVVAASALLVGVALVGAMQLRFSYDPLSWLPETETIRSDTRIVDDRMKGSVSLELLLETRESKGWHEPERLRGLDQMSGEAEATRSGAVFVGKTSSPASVIKEINQALNENRLEFYRVPQDQQLVAQEFFLFESSGSDDLEDVVDTQFRKARFTMKLPALDAVDYSRFVVAMEKRFKEVFGETVEVTATGIVALLFKTITAMIYSMAQSYVIALGVISILMIFLMGNLRMGLLSMIPNLTPIILTMGVMGWLGIPLDAFTLLIGSIAIGLVVDDTIHIMDNFRVYFDETGDVSLGFRKTLQTTGRAVVCTSVVLATGFLIYMGSSMKNLVYFGMLTALTIGTALVADVFLMPALLRLSIRRK